MRIGYQRKNWPGDLGITLLLTGTLRCWIKQWQSTLVKEEPSLRVIGVGA